MAQSSVKILTAFAATLSLLFLAGCKTAAVRLSSPAGNVVADISVAANGNLVYNLKRSSTQILNNSPLGITIDHINLGKDVEIGQPKRYTVNERYSWRGVKSEALNHCIGFTLPITHKPSSLSWTLEARAYDDGFAFRYIVPGKGRRLVTSEATAWQIPPACQIWYQTDTKKYEGVQTKQRIDTIAKGTSMGPPVTIELPDGSFAAVTEGALFNYSGLTLQAAGSPLLQAVFEDDPNGWELDGTIISPWRITMTGPDLNALVNCTIVPSVCPPPDKTLFPDGIHTNWLKPQRAFWSWWSEDTLGPDGQKSYADKASQMGFESILIDYKWEEWPDKWKTLADVVNYARSKNVDVWVWKLWQEIENPAERQAFFKKAVKAGVVGIKIDFMDSESLSRIRFYQSALHDAAVAKLMLNFHGANKPTGESRTYPNEITREAVRALEHNKFRSFPVSHYAALPFTRYLAGPGDFTPCTFNPDFLKGTTFTLQLATAVVYTSPQLVWADKPDLYINSPAAGLIRQIPSVWDETRVLEGSRIGQLAAFARRNGNTWFVGIINAGEKRKYTLALSFLDRGNYTAVFACDRMGTPTAIDVKTMTVNCRQKPLINIDKAGGFVAYFHK